MKLNSGDVSPTSTRTEGVSSPERCASGWAEPRRVAPSSVSGFRAVSGRCSVPESAQGLGLSDLPLSSRLKTALSRRGVGRLGDLDGRRQKELREACGDERTFEELTRLLDSVAAGSARLAEAGAPDSAGSNIIVRLEQLVSGLPAQERKTLALRYTGAEEERAASHRVAPRMGLGSATALGMVLRAVVRIRRQGGPELASQLERIADACLKSARPLTPEVIRGWMSVANQTFARSPAFYMRLMAELSHGKVPVWPVRERRADTKR